MNIIQTRSTGVCVTGHKGQVMPLKSSNGLKAEIDKYFSLNYKKVVSIAQKKVSYYGAECDAETLVAESYLYVINRPPLTVRDIESYVIHFIQIEASCYNSKTRRNAQTVRPGLIESVYKNNVDDHMERYDFDKELHDLKNNKDASTQIVIDMYLIKGIKSVSDLAKHFQITKSSFYRDYRETLTKLKEYEIRKRRTQGG